MFWYLHPDKTLFPSVLFGCFVFCAHRLETPQDLCFGFLLSLKPMLPADPTSHGKSWDGESNGINGKWIRIEDVFPIEDGDFPACYVSLLGANGFLREI